MMIISSLLPFIVLIAVAVLISRAVLQRRGGERADTGTLLRRFFHYVLMLAVLEVVAIGLAGLIEQTLPHPDDLLRDDAALLARSLASILIGGPAFVGLALWSRRLMAEDPTEQQSLGWTFYLTGAMTGALIFGGVAMFRTWRWVFGESSFEPGAVAMAAVSIAVWGSHWVLAGRYGSAVRLRMNLLIGAALGLVTTAWAAGFGLHATLRSLYDQAFNASSVSEVADDLRIAAAGVLVAVPIWWWHWHRRALRDERTPLWHGYVLLIGVLGGVLTALAGAAVVLYSIFEWTVGDPSATRAANHFDILPMGIATLAVGVVAWWYHRHVFGVRAITQRTEVDRMYEYLAAGVGLLTAAGGAITVIATLVQAASPAGAPLTKGGEADALVAGLTLLGVGAPLWLVHWSRARSQVRRDAEAETVSIARRVYVYVLLGAGAVATLFALLAVVIITLEDAFEGQLGGATLLDVRVGLGVLVTGVAVAGYHAAVYRADRGVVPKAVRPAVHDVVLVSSDGEAVAAAIAHETGARVRVWHRLDAPAIAEPSVADVVDAVLAETHEHILVLTRPGGEFEVVPFDDH